MKMTSPPLARCLELGGAGRCGPCLQRVGEPGARHYNRAIMYGESV
jgi:hypothetical protein